jgi:hypothetical protein
VRYGNLELLILFIDMIQVANIFKQARYKASGLVDHILSEPKRIV